MNIEVTEANSKWKRKKKINKQEAKQQESLTWSGYNSNLVTK